MKPKKKEHYNIGLRNPMPKKKEESKITVDGVDLKLVNKAMKSGDIFEVIDIITTAVNINIKQKNAEIKEFNDYYGSDMAFLKEKNAEIKRLKEERMEETDDYNQLVSKNNIVVDKYNEMFKKNQKLEKENQKLQQRLKDIEKIIEKHLVTCYRGACVVVPEYYKIMKDIKLFKTQRGDGE